MAKFTIFKHEESAVFEEHPAVQALAEGLTAAGILFTRHGVYPATLVLHGPPVSGLLYVGGIFQEAGSTYYMYTVAYRRDSAHEDEQLEDHSISVFMRHKLEEAVAYILRNAEAMVDEPATQRYAGLI